MDVQRLVVEESQHSLALDFHAGLTVAFHENPVVRSRCVADLIESLGPGRPGLHLEVVDNQHRHLAVFRPHGARHRVVDIDRADDVTAQFSRPDGRVDLIGRLGLDPDAASRLMRLGVRQIDRGIDTGTDDHRQARRLAGLDQPQLWQAAQAVQAATTALDQARRDLPVDDLAHVAAFGQLAELHRHTEAVVAAHRPVQRLGLALSAVCLVVGGLLLAFDAKIGDNNVTGLALTALGVLAAAVTAVDRFIVHQARAREGRELAGSGVARYDELARQAGPLAQAWRRQALLDASAEHDRAEAAWRELTEDASLSWALQHRAAIEAMATAKGHLRRLGAHQIATEDSGVGDSARVLVDKVIELQEVGVTRERLPLVLDEPFVGFAPVDVERLLSTVQRLAAHHQIVLVTGDPYIQAWATQGAAAATVGFVRLGRNGARGGSADGAEGADADGADRSDGAAPGEDTAADPGALEHRALSATANSGDGRAATRMHPGGTFAGRAAPTVV